MVNCRDRAKRFADLSPSHPQSLECLWRGDLVNEVQIHIQERRLARRTGDNVLVPNFFEESMGHAQL